MINLLATEAEAGGFGLNFDILETNLINLALVIGVVIYFVGGVLKNILAERSATIESEIQTAETRQAEAAAQLKQAQQKMAEAEVEAKQILSNATESAKLAKEEILAHGIREIQRLKDTASQDANTNQERAIAELRGRVTAAALKQVEAQLVSQLSNNSDAQQRLADRSIALLGGS